jgi:opacity protein-like surface antigen
MKKPMKAFLCFLLFILICFNSHSQLFHGGLIGGLTASQVDGDSYSGYNKLGLHAGVYVSTPLTRYLDARLEIRYASRGARNPASEDNTGEYQLGLHYIDLPVMCLFNIREYGAIEIGLIPGYLFASNGANDEGALLDDQLIDFRKFDLGLLMGVKANLTEKIALHVRYSYSVFSIRDLEVAGSYYSWFGKIFGHSRGDFNNYLTLGIGYQIK